MKNHLFRDRAPITEAGWEEIEQEAKCRFRRKPATYSDLIAATLPI